MRASVAAEQAGNRSVSIVGQGFEELARAVARTLGAPDLAIAVYPDVLMTDAQLADAIRRVADDVVAGLLGKRSPVPVRADPSDLYDSDIVAEGTLDEIQEAFEQYGWSDGLPIVPPTPERVEAFLRQT